MSRFSISRNMSALSLLIFSTVSLLSFNCTSQKSVNLKLLAKEAQNEADEKRSPKKQFSKGAKQNAEALRFRSLFYHYAKDEMPLTEFMRTALFPDERLYEGPRENFDAIDKYYQKFTPEMLLLKSFQNAPKKIKKPSASNLPTPTLIVIPGAFSEFASGTIFSEAVDNGSSDFAKKVRKKWRNADAKLKRDFHYDLASLKDKEAPLEELVRFGSIDDQNGNAMINIIFLFPKLGSLESLWTVEEHYAYYKRRLDKFFKIIGPTPRIYISGHSRGGPIALDFITQTAKDPDAQNWTKNIKGFIGFNPALMGLSFADDWFNPTKRLNIFRREILRIKSLEDKNEIIPSIVNREKILVSLKNMGAEFALESSNRFEPTPLNWPDFTAGTKLLSEIEDQLKPESTLYEYKEFIKRLKIGAEAIDQCLKSLSRPIRQNWWKKNVLPTNLRYYTFVASMQSPRSKEAMTSLQRALAESPNMQSETVDYTLWRKIFIEQNASSRVSLLDGPVAAHEGTLWPEWHMAKNPAQKPYEAITLGFFGTHHLGLTYAYGSGDDAERRNPFPRKAFLVTLAQYLNMEEESQMSTAQKGPSIRRARSISH